MLLVALSTDSLYENEMDYLSEMFRELSVQKIDEPKVDNEIPATVGISREAFMKRLKECS